MRSFTKGRRCSFRKKKLNKQESIGKVKNELPELLINGIIEVVEIIDEFPAYLDQKSNKIQL
jgi:hypothetical protein